jgi:ADP-ribose pyrophosphatase YjhB (NUDIX family)
MSDLPKAIRNGAKAVIIRDNNLLTIAKRDSEGLWYLLPGGGQLFGETLEKALKRECLEEIGAVVEIGKLIHVRELIYKENHSVDFLFLCYVADDYIPINGNNPDIGQEEVVWLPIVNLDKYRLYPSPLREILMNQVSEDVYMGNVD